MARIALKPATWPLSLRWVVAMVVVPVLPLAGIAILVGVSLILRLEILFFILIAIGYAMAACVPAAWLSFLPVYFAIDRWGRHSKGTYRGSALAAVFVVAILILFGAEVALPSSQGIGNAVVFGLVVALPTAALMGSMMWCALWSGREVAEAGKS